MGVAYRVPEVYFEPQERAGEVPAVRTDVAGFIGFEPRVRDGTTPSVLTGGTPPVGHEFRVDVAGFQVRDPLGRFDPATGQYNLLESVRREVRPQVDLLLSANPAAIPVTPGQSIVYTLAGGERTGRIEIVVVAGTPVLDGGEQPPSTAQIDAAVQAALATPPPPPPLPGPPPVAWIVIANVHVRREIDAVVLTVHPGLPPVPCDDWRDFVLALGAPQDDGALLGPAVRAFFANGGRRCWVVTVRRPSFYDAVELGRARDEMVGIEGASEREATGLERLLRVREVTIIDVPDLYARRVDRTVRTYPLPPRDVGGCFLPCPLAPRGTATTNERAPAWEPLYTSTPIYAGGPSNEVFDTQRAFLARCIPERWRAFVVLSVPLVLDGGSGPAVPPTAPDAAAWIGQFDRLVKREGFATTDEMACAALYWPWVLVQETVGGDTREVPPSAYAAGVMARRDLARGPYVSPANETLRQVVALTASIDDATHGALYEPDADASGLRVPAVDVLRAFPGYGIQVWGARTLSTETFLRFIAVRRTLTAIELRMLAALELLVFEPNTPLLWLQVTQAALAVLLPIFEDGGLRGSRPEEAFSVRCDASVNPLEAIAEGQLVIEVGVAIAAPAEFIVFRVGRRDGVIEVLE